MWVGAWRHLEAPLPFFTCSQLWLAACLLFYVQGSRMMAPTAAATMTGTTTGQGPTTGTTAATKARQVRTAEGQHPDSWWFIRRACARQPHRRPPVCVWLPTRLLRLSNLAAGPYDRYGPPPSERERYGPLPQHHDPPDEFEAYALPPRRCADMMLPLSGWLSSCRSRRSRVYSCRNQQVLTGSI